MMILTILNILQIATICTLVIDLTDFVDTIKRQVAKWLGVSNVTLKPFDCSLCSTFWISLIYLIVTNNVTLTTISLTLFTAIVILPIIQNALLIVRESGIALTNWILNHIT